MTVMTSTAVSAMPQLPGHLSARPTMGDYRGNLSGYQDAMNTYRQQRFGSGGGTTTPAPTPTGQHPINPAAGGTTTPAAGGTTATPSTNPLTPVNQFANSAGMQFALQQGANALNNLYAAHGQVQSGAAAKALQSYGQNTALQSYFFPYMNYLTGQQAMGAQAASAVAGVGSSYGNSVAGMGQNYANTVGNINQNAAGAIGQGALNIGNANANNAAIGGLAGANLGAAIGSGLGSVGSSFFTPHY